MSAQDYDDNTFQLKYQINKYQINEENIIEHWSTECNTE